MSWPTDGMPRFKVSEPCGYRDDDDRLWVVCYVYDRAYCHETAYTARLGSRWGGGNALAEAKREAARLERAL